MKFKVSFLLFLLLMPLMLVHHQDKEVKPSVKNDTYVLTPLEPITEELNFSAEDKVVAELMAQNIFKQQCSDSILCDFLPEKTSQC